MRIEQANLTFEREPLGAPWGFKGGYLSELWQVVAELRSAGGSSAVGLGTQSVLWCDPRVLSRSSEAAGNAAMLLLTDHALCAARGVDFSSPMELLDAVLPGTLAYGRRVTGIPDLREVFALNAMVAMDNAAWLLWAAEHSFHTFDDLIPTDMRAAMPARQETVVSAPAIGYGLGIDDVVNLVDDGYFLLKIKLGSDPDHDGNPEKMLEWDAVRMEQIHAAVGSREVAGSPAGRPLYYLDANGRYDTKERLLRLLDRVERCGAMNQTILLEEPFPENVREPVSDLPMVVVADESASSVRETIERIDLGYGAVALKPIAKTLSMTFRIVQLCHQRRVPTFCADLTVNPILADWNKNVAARLPSVPGFDGGIQEANGWQNYREWDRMRGYHPMAGGSWLQPRDGRFYLTEDFWRTSGGIFAGSKHYSNIVKRA